MAGPQRHLRIGAEDREILGLHHYGGPSARLGHRHTFVSHAFFAGLRPLTVSKNSVDAENGNSLGGVSSLNMKSGRNTLRGST